MLKHDGAGIFHGQRMRELLEKWKVLDLTGPSYWPRYNGSSERSMRDIKSMVRAIDRAGVCPALKDQIGIAIHDLNEERPRPVLGGRTAREVYERDRIDEIARDAIALEVRKESQKLRATARSRHERRAARRHAIAGCTLKTRSPAGNAGECQLKGRPAAGQICWAQHSCGNLLK